MANEEQLAILEQGVDVWNRWRKENLVYGIDLTGADLRGAYLVGANLNGVDLSKSHLNEANLIAASCINTFLNKVDLSKASLTQCNLHNAFLDDANLSRSNLSFVNFHGAKFNYTIFSKSLFGNTQLGENDLSTCLGLESILHFGGSTIGTDTIKISQGKIPEKFLRGCGLSDWEIESAKLYNPNLSNEEINKITQNIFDLKATQPIQISPLFISYSHANSNFVDKLETKLNEKGIRFWRDIHDAKAGRLETQIDRAIRQSPTVLLILSEHSTNSDWVEHEARLARKLEKELGRDVLCPIALDDSWKTCNWPERIKEQIMEYNILDFSNWEDDAELDAMFKRLIDGLDMFYKG